MKTIVQELVDFKKFTSDERYKLVLGMLKILKDGNENRAYVYETIQKLNPPTDGLLESIYQEILELSQKKDQKIKELESQSFNRIKDRMKEIQVLEKKEQEGNDTEQLLKNL